MCELVPTAMDVRASGARSKGETIWGFIFDFGGMR